MAGRDWSIDLQGGEWEQGIERRLEKWEGTRPQEGVLFNSKSNRKTVKVFNEI